MSSAWAHDFVHAKTDPSTIETGSRGRLAGAARLGIGLLVFLLGKTLFAPRREDRLRHGVYAVKDGLVIVRGSSCAVYPREQIRDFFMQEDTRMIDGR